MRELYVRHNRFRLLVSSTAGALQGVIWADLVFAWFGGFHALLPFLFARMLGKKCMVVCSGYDVANRPEIGYGNMRPGIRRWIGRLIFKLAHRILAVSEFSAQEAIKNTGASSGKVQIIYHGLASPPAATTEGIKRRRQVLTVGGVTHDNLTRKGIQDFVHVALGLPDIQFLLVGPHQDDAIVHLRQIAPTNLQLVGPCYGDQLTQKMTASSVYCQLSAYESFGMAVAEAMLCGCIPVVSNRGALPEVVGDTGLVVPYSDINASIAAVQAALAASLETRELCCSRVLQKFSLEERRQKLLIAIHELLA